jgi:outer membrane immunogenic protein
VEAQGDWSRLRGFDGCFTEAAPGAAFDVSNRCGTTVNALGTVAARLGLTTSDHTLVFVKGGWAWANDTFSLHTTNNPNALPPPFTWTYNYISSNRSGGMIGLGIEQAFDSNWSAKVEYDYMDLGTKGYTFVGTLNLVPAAPVNFSTNITQNIHLIKVGLNYHFH